MLDFTNVDLYPNYWSKKDKDGLLFEIKSLIIENVKKQADRLLVGDTIKVATKFGHNTNRTGEKWIDVPLCGEFKITGIFPKPEENEIQLLVLPKRFRITSW